MPKSPFVLPEGVNLSVHDDRVAIAYDGDVVLQHDFRGDVIAGGHVLVHGSVSGSLDASADVIVEGSVTGEGDVRAKRRITITKGVDVDSLRAWEIHLKGGEVKARSIVAESRIIVGGATLKVDILMAPEVVIDDGAKGKVTVIERHNDGGKGSIKPAMSVEDYDDMMGDAADYLSDRGVLPLAQGGGPPEPEVPALSVASADDGDDIDLDDDYMTSDVGDEDAVSDEDVDDPISLTIEDIEPVDDRTEEIQLAPEPEPEPDADDAPTEESALGAAVARIEAVYNGNAPDPVAALRAKVDAGDSGGIKKSLDGLWMDLLTHHQANDLAVNPKVTAAFHRIRAEVG